MAKPKKTPWTVAVGTPKTKIRTRIVKAVSIEEAATKAWKAEGENRESFIAWILDGEGESATEAPVPSCWEEPGSTWGLGGMLDVEVRDALIKLHRKADLLSEAHLPAEIGRARRDWLRMVSVAIVTGREGWIRGRWIDPIEEQAAMLESALHREITHKPPETKVPETEMDPQGWLYAHPLTLARAGLGLGIKNGWRHRMDRPLEFMQALVEGRVPEVCPCRWDGYRETLRPIDRLVLQITGFLGQALDLPEGRADLEARTPQEMFGDAIRRTRIKPDSKWLKARRKAWLRLAKWLAEKGEEQIAPSEEVLNRYLSDQQTAGHATRRNMRHTLAAVNLIAKDRGQEMRGHFGSALDCYLRKQ